MSAITGRSLASTMRRTASRFSDIVYSSASGRPSAAEIANPEAQRAENPAWSARRAVRPSHTPGA
nr:hypothetical protein [Actinomadura madurae]